MIGIGIGIGFNERVKKIYFSDNFNRPDNASIGGAWTVNGGTWGIASGKATNTSTGGGDEYCLAPETSADFALNCDIEHLGGYSGIAFRIYDFQNHYYAFIDGSNTLMLARKIGGTFTGLGSKSSVLPGTYNFRLICIGEEIKLYLNQELQFNITESTIMTSSKAHGMWKFQPDDRNTWDNFVLEAIS